MAGGDSLLPDVPEDQLVAGQKADIESLSEALGHRFARRDLLIEALTHKSAAGDGNANRFGYERLEFLGDRVLGLIIADILLKRFPDEDEGSLAPRFAALVRREALAEVAMQIGLARNLVLAPGEGKSGGRTNSGLLADACEAIIAALYLDAGLETASRFIVRYWAPLMAATDKPPRDAKTTPQEWAQERKLHLPGYPTLSRPGPPPSPPFTVRPIADALSALDAIKAMVVHSHDGLDELSVTAPTRVAFVENGAVREEVVDPAALGLATAPREAVEARDLDHAARIIRDVLAGTDTGPARTMTLLNTAATLLVADLVATWSEGLALAAETIDGGRARDTLEKLAALSRT